MAAINRTCAAKLQVEVIRTAVEGWLKAAPPDGGSAVDFFAIGLLIYVFL